MVPGLIHIWKFVSRIFYTIIEWKGKESSLLDFEIPTKQVVGIFSRDEIPQWLQDVLSSETLLIKKVRSFYISNNSYQSIREETTHCNFAILYHTKNRGRVNITDVTDSLYDQELQVLSTRLGKEKVIVLVDDLDDGGPQTMENILKNQPSIGKYAQDLVLVSVSEKDHHEDSFTEKQRHLLAIMAKIMAKSAPLIVNREGSILVDLVRFVMQFWPIEILLKIMRLIFYPPSLVYGRIRQSRPQRRT